MCCWHKHSLPFSTAANQDGVWVEARRAGAPADHTAPEGVPVAGHVNPEIRPASILPCLRRSPVYTGPGSIPSIDRIGFDPLVRRDRFRSSLQTGLGSIPSLDRTGFDSSLDRNGFDPLCSQAPLDGTGFTWWPAILTCASVHVVPLIEAPDDLTPDWLVCCSQALWQPTCLFKQHVVSGVCVVNNRVWLPRWLLPKKSIQRIRGGKWN